jgi:hypothetical protein
MSAFVLLVLEVEVVLALEQDCFYAKSQATVCEVRIILDFRGLAPKRQAG